MASVNGFENDLDGGLSVVENKHAWHLAIGMELKLFDGGLIKNRVAAAKGGTGTKGAAEAAPQRKHCDTDQTPLPTGRGPHGNRSTSTQQAVDTSEQNLDLSNRALPDRCGENRKGHRGKSNGCHGTRQPCPCRP